ncbi:hypothetical protein PSACC_01797 [Paramicrosporidium saccamoebae]|uniref:Bms1-type G domain-containing protein n=1 Tax=Paramicrosporidium saccamoebae TaxID=1246581 RepID=A0A2H9TKT5_9FUNG|nr:hypothetical protein PSACC_01797 [Paramicrosporidium saccamoebae]
MSEEKKGHHHRSSLKQRNKPFKGGARSHSRGRIERKKGSASVTADLSKADRKNKAALLQQQKRNELAAQRRVYSGRDGMSRVIAVIPVSSSVDMARVLPFSGRYYSERNKQNLQFINCERVNDHSKWILQVMDAAQIADCILLVASSVDEDLDGFGRDALAVIRGIGVSSSAAVLQQLTVHKHPQTVRSGWLGMLQAVMSSVGKAYCTESMMQGDDSREALELERLLCQQHLNGISWRDPRPYMISDSVTIRDGVAQVTGCIRGGKPFSANQLVHFQNETFAVSKIEAIPRTGRSSMEVDSPLTQIREEDKAEPLESEGAGDPFSAEAMMQAAEEEMAELHDNVEMANTSGSIKVPKGTSSYQAAWIDQVGSEEDEEMEEIQAEQADSGSEIDEGMDIDEHNAKLQEHKELVFTERHFADEIELNHEMSARSRLQKYRGVQSMRTSSWDVNENLPFDYGKIFRFANYRQSRKIALEGCGETVISAQTPFLVGQRVILYISGMSSEQLQRLEQAGQNVSVFGLLKHEQRKTVVNFTLNRCKSFEGTLSNKEELVAMIGFRKFFITPIFSEHTTTNLHKMLRQVGPEIQTMFVGTVYAPVTYNPAPVLLFRCTPNGLELVASGSVQDLDPHRVILKRITLTGLPYKVHKRSAVVRFMFATPEDVMWFKPVELSTRLGGRGHIRESLGTHGYMKCQFDRVIFHHDSVAMHLYKRVFPKWTTRSL